MKKIDLGQTITILANFGVIVGIAFLAIEINQANRIARYTAENARRSQFIEINASAMQYSETYAKLQAGEAELTPSERVVALMFARQLYNSWQDAESAFEAGLLSEETFRIVVKDPSVVMKETPGLAPYFAYLLDAYADPDNLSLVAREIAEALSTVDSN
jgi:ABC-type amino acid transport substrate-binding protein